MVCYVMCLMKYCMYPPPPPLPPPPIFLRKQPKQTAVGVQVDLFLDPVEPVAPQPCSPQDHTSPPNFSTPKPLLAPVHAPSSADDTTQTTTATLTSTLQESNPSSPKAATLNYHDLTLASEQAERVRAGNVL